MDFFSIPATNWIVEILAFLAMMLRLYPPPVAPESQASTSISLPIYPPASACWRLNLKPVARATPALHCWDVALPRFLLFLLRKSQNKVKQLCSPSKPWMNVYIISFETGSCYLVQASFKFTEVLLQPPNSGITDVYHSAWQTPSPFDLPVSDSE